MFTAWAKVIETSATFLEKAVDAGIQHWRSKYEALLGVAREMMAELRNKNQACEAMAVAMEHKDKKILNLESTIKEKDFELEKLRNLLEDKR